MNSFSRRHDMKKMKKKDHNANQMKFQKNQKNK